MLAPSDNSDALSRAVIEHKQLVKLYGNSLSRTLVGDCKRRTLRHKLGTTFVYSVNA